MAVRTRTNINSLVRDNISAIIAESVVNLGRSETQLLDMCRQNIIEMRDNPNLTESDIEQMKREELLLETQYNDAVSSHTRLLNRHHSFITQLPGELPEERRQPLLVKKTVVKTAEISPAEGAKFCDDVCSICANNHTVLQSCVTDCGHWFCGDCYKPWMQRFSAQASLTSCPICRELNKEVTVYCTSKTPISKKGAASAQNDPTLWLH